VSAANFVVMKDFEKYFEGFTGTFVMYDEANDQYIVFNEPQSVKRLSPCSTFKIYNSLIGLETGVLDQEDVYTLFKWNGTQYPFPAWNHDQTLASATRDSVVWYFQELASRIGTERMQAYLNNMEYGNQDISGGLTTFWLRSSLQISAQEQVDLLHRLYSGKLPVSLENVEVVKKNITLSEDNGVRLMGKTGSGFQDGKWLLGWFVGCVEKGGDRYFVATNIQAPDGAMGGKAREITKVILKDLGVL
jgi:bla regulator protein BlaR1